MEALASYRLPIEEGQLRRFAEASWDTASATRAVAPELPPTFLGAAATICGRPHSLPLMGFDVARAFHGTETVHLLSPVAVGDLLRVEESIHHLPGVCGRRGGWLRRAVRRSLFFDAVGSQVALVDRVILEAQRLPAAAPPDVDLTLFDDGLDARPDPVRGQPVAADRLRPETTLEAASFGPLTRADFVRYAAASGDFTAVHFDEYAATSRGYPAPFAMGMLSAAYIGHMLMSWVRLSPPWKLSVRFRDQLWPGETVLVSGHVGSEEGATRIFVECATVQRVITTATLQLGQAR